jgi:hypothetical protein
LPGVENATLDLRKVTEYLFNPTNPDGWAKGQFFRRFGFDEKRPDELARALLQHAQDNAVTRSDSTVFGAKWEVTGPLRSPDGRNPVIRSVWHRNGDESAPHFVSVSLRIRRGIDESSTV